jgi:hypothetical protein
MLQRNIDKINEVNGVSFIYTLKPTLNLLGLNPSSNETIATIINRNGSNAPSVNLSLHSLEQLDGNEFDIMTNKTHQQNAKKLLTRFSIILNECFKKDVDVNQYGIENIGIFKEPLISGYRSLQTNDIVGGATNSRHLSGEALDFDLQYKDSQKVSVIKIFYFILKEVYKIDQHILGNIFDIRNNNDKNSYDSVIYTFKDVAYLKLQQIPPSAFNDHVGTFFIYVNQNFIHFDIRETNGKINFQAKGKPGAQVPTVRIDDDN